MWPVDCHFAVHEQQSIKSSCLALAGIWCHAVFQLQFLSSPQHSIIGGFFNAGSPPMTTIDRTEQLKSLLQERILILDGAMGTMIQRHKLDEAAYRGERFCRLAI